MITKGQVKAFLNASMAQYVGENSQPITAAQVLEYIDGLESRLVILATAVADKIVEKNKGDV